MVVTADRTHGSVGGGRLEQRAIEIARKLLVADSCPPRLERFALGASLGQCCGGVVVLVFEPVGPAQRAWVRDAAALAASGRAWGRRVRIDGPCAGEVAVFDGDSLEHTCGPAHAAHARTLLAAGAETALLLATPCRRAAGREPAAEPASTPGLGTARDTACETTTLLDASPPPALQVVMFGAGHVGRALAELFGRLPLRVRWIDERAGEFPPTVAANIETRCTDTPTAEVRDAPAAAVFLVLTHSHALDFELIEAILARADFRFCGLIGSRTKRARFAHRLHARGIDEARIARVRCPVGLPGLAGKEAEVIALAIAAEVMRLRPQTQPASLPRRRVTVAPAAQPTESGQET